MSDTQEIFPSDIRFFESERMDQSAYGGGWLTGREIVSGQMNNAFKQIARIQRVYGSVELLRMGARIMTDNDGLYAGAHVALTDTPIDTEVSFLLFESREPDERRTDIVDYIESYYNPMHAVGNAPLRYAVKPGDRQLVFILRHKEYTPMYKDDGQLNWLKKIDAHYALNLNVGDTLLLPGSTTDPDHENNEAVQIERVEIREEKLAFAESSNEYIMRYMLVTTASPLIRNHPQNVTPRAMVTNPGWRAYGASTLAVAVEPGEDRIYLRDNETRLNPVIQRQTRVRGMKLYSPPSLEEVSMGTGDKPINLQVEQTSVSEWMPSQIENLYVYDLQLGTPRPGSMRVMYLNNNRWQVVEENSETPGSLTGAGMGTIVNNQVTVAISETADPGTHVLFFYQLNNPYRQVNNLSEIMEPFTPTPVLIETDNMQREEKTKAFAPSKPVYVPERGDRHVYENEVSSKTWNGRLREQAVMPGTFSVFVSLDDGGTWALAARDNGAGLLTGDAYEGQIRYEPEEPDTPHVILNSKDNVFFDGQTRFACFYKGGTLLNKTEKPWGMDLNVAIASYRYGYDGFWVYNYTPLTLSVDPGLGFKKDSSPTIRLRGNVGGNAFDTEATLVAMEGSSASFRTGNLVGGKGGHTNAHIDILFAPGSIKISTNAYANVIISRIEAPMSQVSGVTEWMYFKTFMDYGAFTLPGQPAEVVWNMREEGLLFQGYPGFMQGNTYVERKKTDGTWGVVLSGSGDGPLAGEEGYEGEVIFAPAQVRVRFPGFPYEEPEIRIRTEAMQAVLDHTFSANINLPFAKLYPGGTVFQYWVDDPETGSPMAWLARDNGKGRLLLSGATATLETLASLNLTAPYGTSNSFEMSVVFGGAYFAMNICCWNQGLNRGYQTVFRSADGKLWYEVLRHNAPQETDPGVYTAFTGRCEGSGNVYATSWFRETSMRSLDGGMTFQRITTDNFPHNYHRALWVGSNAQDWDYMIAATGQMIRIASTGTAPLVSSSVLGFLPRVATEGTINAKRTIFIFLDDGGFRHMKVEDLPSRWNDATVWTTGHAGYTGRPVSARIINNVVWVATNSNDLFKSVNGIHFIFVGRIPFTSVVTQLDIAADKIMACSATGELATSEDNGDTWTLAQLAEGFDRMRVTYAGGDWFILGWQKSQGRIRVVKEHIDRMRDVMGNVVSEVGTIDYDTGTAAITAGYPPTNVVCLNTLAPVQVDKAAVHTWGASPVVPGSFEVRARGEDKSLLTLRDQGNNMVGDGTGLANREKGYALCEFARPITPETIEVDYGYNVSFRSEFPDLDTTSLPLSGKVPVFSRGDIILLTDRARHQLVTTMTDNAMTARIKPGTGLPPDFGDGLRFLIEQEMVLASGVENGVLTLTARGIEGTTAAMHLAGAFVDLHPEDRREERVPTADVLGKDVFTANVITQHFNAGAICSSILRKGDVYAMLDGWHTQQAWNNTWISSREYNGNAAADTYNFTDYPIQLTNKGAVEEDWLIRVTATNPVKVEVRGKRLGVIAENLPISEDIAPNNPRLNAPYFRLKAEGWGGGWQNGNCLRFATTGAEMGVWVARCINARASEQQDDSATIGTFGDVAT